MFPIPLEYESSICEIKTKDNELISTGVIRRITPEYIEIADKFSTMSLIRYATEVKTNIFNSKLGFRVIVGKVYTSSTEFVRLTEVRSVLDYERRNFFRLELNLDAKMIPHVKSPMYAPVHSGGSAAENGQFVRVLLKNLSLGGALIISEYPLGLRDHLLLRFRINRKECEFQSIVRRVEKINDDLSYYGCEFLNVSQSQSNTLCAYIFQKQREQIHMRDTQHAVLF